ncbi:serine aminopeptidase domain-containing protein [Ichthyenterobacterium magnum]|uniref:Serine aminopeptidase S33 domain-containing protein n=1 Tax=Ichthyenterobacterium magnum TaxID=1230530 RepID=A0A420DKM2_9FLAO|nr:alpha/beta hydrolase [Ichthyenterobacterium magnum]RKE94806.1 hypothetical protein BXY80_1819 [Ichthyenterobacterium magnum]
MLNKKTLALCVLMLSFTVLHFAQQLKRKATLGVRLAPLTEEMKKSSKYTGDGIYVEAVNPNGSAGLLKLPSGAILQRVNGQTLKSRAELRPILDELREDNELSLTYFFNNQSKTIKGKALGKPVEVHSNANVHYDAVAYKDNLLRSILYTPKGINNAPVVFYLQGYTCQSIEYPNKNPIKELINGWISSGFAVYLIEKPGSGDSKSKIACKDIDFNQEKLAFNSAYKNLLKNKLIDSNNIFLFGHSMGGVTAPILANQQPPKGIITFGTVGKNWYEYMKDVFTEQQELFGAQKEQIAENAKQNIPFITDMMINKKSNIEMINNEVYKEYLTNQNLIGQLKKGYYLGRSYKFWASLGDIDIPKAWKSVNTNVLVMHGEFDIQAIHKRYAEIIVDMVNNNHGKAKFALLKNTDHVLLKFNSMQENIDTLNSGNYRSYMRNNFNPEVTSVSVKWMQSIINN